MSYGSKKEATAGAKKVQAMMDAPKDWTIRVHENIGWHASLLSRDGRIAVYGDADGKSFSTLMNSDGSFPGAGDPKLTTNGARFKTPQDAVDAQIVIFLAWHEKIAVAHAEVLRMLVGSRRAKSERRRTKAVPKV